MKKVFKFFAALASLAAVAGGAYLVYKNFFAKEDEDFDFDDRGDIMCAIKLATYRTKGKDCLFFDHPYEVGLAVFERPKA